jgi:hypothetical protein
MFWAIPWSTSPATYRKLRWFVPRGRKACRWPSYPDGGPGDSSCCHTEADSPRGADA